MPPEAMAPLSATGIVGSSPVKNFMPSEFVTVGPLKPCITRTGWFGVTVSSSCRVGMRGAAGGGVNWLMLKPPSAVSQSPLGFSRARAAKVSSTSAIERAFSMRVSWPGRRPSRTIWLWLSIIPGTTVRPRRLISRVQSSLPWCQPWPTSAKRPFLMSTEDTTRSLASIVWILPFTSLSDLPSLHRCPSRSSSSCPRAGSDSMVAASAAAASRAQRETCTELSFTIVPLL